MGATFRDKLKQWGNQAEREPVVVRVWFHAHNGERNAYAAARKIVTQFGALKVWERKKWDTAQRRKGELRLPVTPYEDIYCSLKKHDDHYAVTFIHTAGEVFDEMYDDGKGGNGSVFPSPVVIEEDASRPHDILEALEGVDDIFAVPPKD